MKLIALESLKGCCIIRPHGREEIALTQKFSERLNHFEIPTVDADPVRHGEWVETEPDEDDRKIGIEFSIKCSRCHDENSHLDFNENHEITGKTFWKSRFCPNCGARMDGGADNG